MESVKAFIFKERSLRSLIWLWGILGTLILSLIVDLLSNSFLSGPWGYGNSFWLIAIYYFFTLAFWLMDYEYLNCMLNGSSETMESC